MCQQGGNLSEMDEMLVKRKLILFGNRLKKWVLLEDALSEVTRFIAIYGHINGFIVTKFSFNRRGSREVEKWEG